MRLDAVQRVADHERVGAIAADQPVPAEQPDIAKRAYGICRRLRRFVRIGEAAAAWFSSGRTPTKRIEGLVTASQIPAASAASFFCLRSAVRAFARRLPPSRGSGVPACG